MQSWLMRTLPSPLLLTKLFGNRLFGVHINDARRDWDWDMNMGAVHLLDTMEWLYWVDKIGFDGFYTLDIWPADGFFASNSGMY